MSSSSRQKAARRPQPSGPNPKVIAVALGVVALVVAVGLAIALTGDDGDEDVTAGSGSGTGTGTAGAPAGPLAHGTVDVDGGTLAPFVSPAQDPAVGQPAPVLSGQALDSAPVEVGFDEPTLLVFLAHWCSHCQAELPRLVELANAGELDGVRAVAVLTGTNADAPNFPPGAWLEREGWDGDVLVDDEAGTAATAYGLTSYPYLVAVDAGGEVVGRVAGQQPEGQVVALVEAAAG